MLVPIMMADYDSFLKVRA